MKKRMLSKRLLVGALALAMVTTAVYAITLRVGTARADSGPVGICIQGTTQCLDDEGNLTTPNNPIVLETLPVPIQQSFQWNLAQVGTVSYANCKPFTYVDFRTGNCDIDQRYDTEPVYKIEKVIAGGHNGCIGLYMNALSWESCTAIYTDWVLSDYSYFVSVGRTNNYDSATPWVMTANIAYPSLDCITSNGWSVIVGSLGTGHCNLKFNTGG
jgi:hypothetical protein